MASKGSNPRKDTPETSGKQHPPRHQSSEASAQAEALAAFRATTEAQNQADRRARRRQFLAQFAAVAGIAAVVGAVAAVGVVTGTKGSSNQGLTDAASRPQVAAGQSVAGAPAAGAPAASAAAKPQPTWPRDIASAKLVETVPKLHQVTGRAHLLQNEDGSQLVELEGLSLTNWRDDWFVYAVEKNKARKPDGTRLGYIADGDLGTRRFKVPSDVLLSKPLTIMIWCDGAQLPITVADLPLS